MKLTLKHKLLRKNLGTQQGDIAYIKHLEEQNNALTSKLNAIATCVMPSLDGAQAKLLSHLLYPSPTIPTTVTTTSGKSISVEAYIPLMLSNIAGNYEPFDNTFICQKQDKTYFALIDTGVFQALDTKSVKTLLEALNKS